MTTRITETTPRQAALVAGVSYLFLFALAIFANFFVRSGLVDPNNAATTVANIVDSELLFRAGLVSFLIIFILDVVVAWALYVLFKTVSRQFSLLSAWFRLVYTVFLGVAVIFLFGVLHLVGGASYLAALEPGQLDAQVMLLLEAFNYAWLIGLASFGLHLMLIGYLMIKSGIGPRVIGILLAVAGAAYVLDTLAYSLLADYAEYEAVFLTMVAAPSVVAEFAFAIWLLARAGKTSDGSGEHGAADVAQPLHARTMRETAYSAS